MNAHQAGELMAFLDEFQHEPDTVEGPRDAVELFIEHWIQSPHRSHTVLLNQGLYELRSVQETQSCEGTMILGTQQHLEILTQFLIGFMKDCFPNDTRGPEWLAQRAKRLAANGKAYLWQDSSGLPVSMASIVRESPNTSSISLVYTPPEERGNGYAGKLMAALSQSQLNQGKTACNLFTDLENMTSNRVYLRVGYQQILQCLRVKLMNSFQA